MKSLNNWFYKTQKSLFDCICETFFWINIKKLGVLIFTEAEVDTWLMGKISLLRNAFGLTKEDLPEAWYVDVLFFIWFDTKFLVIILIGFYWEEYEIIFVFKFEWKSCIIF